MFGAYTTVHSYDAEEGTYEASIRLGDPAQVVAHLQKTILIADVGWYFAIASSGYERIPFDESQLRSWAFFPLFPIAWALVARVTGEYALTGAALSHAFLLVALVVFARLAERLTADRALAARAVVYLGFAPSSYFFSLPLTESFYLLLSVGSLSAAVSGRWWMAGALGALAAATRPIGILLFPVLAITRLASSPRGIGTRVAWGYVPLLLVPLGLLGFMWYLSQVTGNPWAFRDIQASWGRTFGVRSMVLPFAEYLRDPGALTTPWNLTLLNAGAAVTALAAAVALAVERRWAFALYTFAGVLVPLSTLSLGSMARYTLVLFPVFLVLARLGCWPLVDHTIKVAFVALLSVMAALFGAHFTFALS